jgi:hypothetical protein
LGITDTLFYLENSHLNERVRQFQQENQYLMRDKLLLIERLTDLERDIMALRDREQAQTDARPMQALYVFPNMSIQDQQMPFPQQAPTEPQIGNSGIPFPMRGSAGVSPPSWV